MTINSKEIVYCKNCFEVTFWIKNESDLIHFNSIKDNLKSTYRICMWLYNRNIKYKLKFKYNKNQSINWNIKKFKSYLFLRFRLWGRT